MAITPITTLDRVKVILKINDTNSDDLITMLIPMVQDEFTTYCNYIDDLGQPEQLPAVLELPAIKTISREITNPNNYTSESVGDVSVSYNITVPDDIKTMLNKVRKLKFF